MQDGNKRLEMKGGSLIYEESREGVAILGIRGDMVRISVPEMIAQKPVAQIAKKAFFNCRSLRFVSIPDTVGKIESWAFAHCPRLERVELPFRRIDLGKDLFLGSDRLREIVLRPAEGTGTEDGGPVKSAVAGGGQQHESGQSMEISRLLAAAATKMGAPHLFLIEEAGSGEWLHRWDARLLVLMREDDNDGYEKQVLAGEEDYEKTDQVRYRSQKRQAKVRLAMLRLLNPCGLSAAVQKELETYLLAHTKGCIHEETWEVVRQEYGDEKAYYELFAALGCVTGDNFDGILQDIGDGHTEMKAYLMRYQEEKMGRRDFFDGLSLDF